MGDISLVFDSVSIDSRKISGRDLFVAIRGANHDGHNFIEQVSANNGKGFVINKKKAADISILFNAKEKVSVIAVDDTVRALGAMAAFQKNRAVVKVVAITGSNGKTTTRGLTESIFKQKFSTLATRGNFNNEIGLPLTLLRLSHDNDWAVVELGMNRPGEIKSLADISRPDIGIITNISAAHIEGLGSIDGVMKAKTELIDGISPSGLAILNADDPRLVHIAENVQIDVLMYGFSEKAEIRANDNKPKGYGSSFLLTTPSGKVQIDLTIPGEFMISNATAAAAAGHAAGLSLEEIKNGIESFQPEHGRMSIIKTQKGITIIDDTYNANPASMEAAISTLCSLKGENNGFLIAGDMLEMGSYAKEAHHNVGASAVKFGISGIYTTGKYAEDVASGAVSEKMDARAIYTGSKEDILEQLKKSLSGVDWVLVKGSRAMGMETVVKELKEWGERV
ncbi:MAG: UDP-N-acetylmuramoyl-tripeptide--D-alanyl-D-alanine ligase [Deltaproteobacteria bacterium]|nr:UDP-N-acetylmuramoyl-tripeptide--D-alanyl-D-alanine ligase [Deltaproteobacteria bacterium]